jgi:hypothetical protein
VGGEAPAAAALLEGEAAAAAAAAVSHQLVPLQRSRSCDAGRSGGGERERRRASSALEAAASAVPSDTRSLTPTCSSTMLEAR